MALKDIRKIVAPEIGQSDFDLNPEAKSYIDALINRACEELYDSTDLPGCLREVYVRVTAHKRIALPPFIGEIRNLREALYGYTWHLGSQQERYHLNKWVTEFNRWTFVGYSPLGLDITNAAPLTYKIAAADSSVIVTATGSTPDAAFATESITMDAISKPGVKTFIHVNSITLNKKPNHNIQVVDANNREMALIYNTMTEARYLILDVSQYPNLGECGDGTKVMEVLYKIPLRKLVDDDDVFPLPDWDTIIAYKAIQLNFEGQEGKEDRVQMMHSKINLLMSRKITDKKSGIGNAVTFGENAMLSVLEDHSPYTTGGYHGILRTRRF